ncbi:hypothetical protein J6590_043441 [Homalodisca vitripennis]|nr:hypothetical protein J6590_043441 [Homalodisca vitripennis]
MACQITMINVDIPPPPGPSNLAFQGSTPNPTPPPKTPTPPTPKPPNPNCLYPILSSFSRYALSTWSLQLSFPRSLRPFELYSGIVFIRILSSFLKICSLHLVPPT